jgi:hypothetical protein
MASFAVLGVRSKLVSNLHELSWRRAEPIRSPVVTLIDDVIDALLLRQRWRTNHLSKKAEGRGTGGEKATADRPGLFIEKSNAMMG